MSQSKNSLPYLEHILDSIVNIEQYLNATKNEDEFLHNSLVQDAVIRNLEIIGEAAKKVEMQVKKESSEIEWKAMAGMRDKLIHDYFGVDLTFVWTTVKKDLPKLKKKIKALIKNLNSN